MKTTTSGDLVNRLNQPKPAIKKAIDFDTWMREKIHNIHYASNEKMSNAYKKLAS